MTRTFVKTAQRLALCFFLFNATLLTAQTHKHTNAHDCGTPPMTADQIRYTLDVVAKKAVLRNAGTRCVPLQAFITRNTDGSGGMTYLQLNQGLANLNYLYKSANIEFYWSGLPKYANNTDYNEYSEDPTDNDTEAGLRALFTDDQTAVSVFLTRKIADENGAEYGGYAYYPENSVAKNFMHMNYFVFYHIVWSTGAHEMGHYFNLAHTFDKTESGETGADAENVARSGVQKNCDVAGDFLCDTEADPKYTTTSCNFVGNKMDRFGVAYTPSFTNIMSYYDFGCRNDNVVTFTPQQYARIDQGLTTRLSHTAYSLNAPPMNVINPSVATATQNALAVVLNWTDNATNEMGYLIERSTVSNSSGFKALKFGATADNVTTFTDNDVVPNTMYHYRVKASNDGCNDYSNVTSITVVPAYCAPTYTTVCAVEGSIPKSIKEFTLKTAANAPLFSNPNNGCAGALADFTANPTFTANVTAGTTYNFTVKLGTSSSDDYYSQNIGVWLDINNNKTFTDASENLGIFNHNVYGNYEEVSGSFTIPAATTNGARRLRIRATPSNGGMTSASICSNFSYGEAEDYTLNVSGGVALPISLLRFQGQNTEGANFLNWQTESEVNASHFEVERSENGQNFSKIATVKAFGKANNYAFNDKNSAQNTHYYRLKMVDNNGVFEYSKIIALHAGKHKNVSLFIYPNPVSQLLTIETTEEGDRQVVNLLGQTVLRSKTTQQLDVSALPSGTYFLKIGGQQARFVKQ